MTRIPANGPDTLSSRMFECLSDRPCSAYVHGPIGKAADCGPLVRGTIPASWRNAWRLPMFSRRSTGSPVWRPCVRPNFRAAIPSCPRLSASPRPPPRPLVWRGAAVAEIRRLRGGAAQSLSVDLHAAAASLVSFALLRLDGEAVPRPAETNPTVGFYRAGCGRWIHLHGGFPASGAGHARICWTRRTMRRRIADCGGRMGWPRARRCAGPYRSVRRGRARGGRMA